MLVDLKSDLKKLKFSQFGVNPAIVKDINNPPKYNAEPLQAGRRIDDLVRITKFVASANGLKFVAKQGLLSQINQEQPGQTRKEKLKAAVKAGAISAAKVLGSTLAQVPVTGTGVHFIRGFGGYSYLTPGVPSSPLPGVLGAIQNFSQNKLGLGGGVNGSEIVLAGNNIILDYLGGDNFTPQAESELLDTLKDENGGTVFNPNFGDTNNVKQDTYLGGSDVKALGPLREGAKTPIIFDQRANESNPRAIAAEREDEESRSLRTRNRTGNGPGRDRSDLAFTERQVPDKAKVAEKKGTTELTNFLKTPNTQTAPNRRPKAEDYNSDIYNLQKRTNMGNPGSRVDKSDVKKREQPTVDEVNELSVRTSAYDFEAFGTLDIIPFEIEVISPDSRSDKRYSTNNFIYFRAHLDSFSDDYTGNWNETKYIGRAEPMYTYDGFNRSVSFAFKIAAFSRSELLPLYQKLNFLASSTAPTYNGSGAFMRGTFSRLTIGDYLYHTPGFFNKIGISWEVGYPWEINLENDNELPKVPHILNVDCGFTPVHNFIPALNQPFIMKDSFYTHTNSTFVSG